MKKFIKENLVLVLGLTLPILLIVLFFFASVLPKMLGEPPQFEMLFVSTKYQYDNKVDYVLDFSVKGEQVMVESKQKKKDGKYSNRKGEVLFTYDGKTQTIREITVDGSQLVEGISTPVEEVSHMLVNTAGTSPDGYTFEGSRYRSRGLVTGLFGGSNRGYYRLVKGNVSYKLPMHKQNNRYNSYYNQLTFLGWVANNKGE